MSVTIRAYRDSEDVWEVDIRVQRPDGEHIRERRKAPTASKTAARRWAEARERVLLIEGKPKPTEEETEVLQITTLKDFAPRFIDGYARANRQKPSGIATKESILRSHLVPLLGHRPLGEITTAVVQQFKAQLAAKAPKTVNNILTVLNVLLRTAVDWNLIERMPCTIRLVPTVKPTAEFHDFPAYESLVEAARAAERPTYLIVLLGGEAGLRCGEIMALQWRDVDVAKRQLSVTESDWKGHVTAPKSGRLRRVPMTERLERALREGRHLRSPRVVTDAAGLPLTQKVVQRLVGQAARRAKVKPGVHILRHTFCSHLAMRGAPARAIQELAGHQDLSTTQRYMHLSPAALDAAIRLLDGPGISPGLGEILEAAGKEG